jgi:hypothetical protein
VDVATGLAAFAQYLGGALFVSFAQAIFSSRLHANLISYLPASVLDGSHRGIIEEVVSVGATGIKAQLLQQGISETAADEVLRAWNDAVTDIFVRSFDNPARNYSAN